MAVGPLKRFVAMRRLLKAAALWRRSAISDSDYAFIAIVSVAEGRGESVWREQGWLNVTFELEAAAAMGIWRDGSGSPPADFSEPLKRFDPLAKSFYALPGAVEHSYPHPTELTEAVVERARRGRNDRMIEHAWHWGPESSINYRRACVRLYWWNRAAEKADAWFSAESERLPNVSKATLALLSLVTGVLVGWLLPR